LEGKDWFSTLMENKGLMVTKGRDLEGGGGVVDRKLDKTAVW
jgi:hypothetical protein